MFTATYKEHIIQVELEIFGKEIVYYDGQRMVEAFSLLGTTHSFSVFEDGERVQYNAEVGPDPAGLFLRPYVIVRRNGSIIFSSK